jgi:hypothetical protein
MESNFDRRVEILQGLFKHLSPAEIEAAVIEMDEKAQEAANG